MEAAYLDLASHIDRFTQDTLSVEHARQNLHVAAANLLQRLKLSDDNPATSSPHNIDASTVSNGVPATYEYTATDLNGLNKCLFNWCDSYDNKDWERLAGNIAPTLDLDYTALGMQRWPSLSAADYLATVSSPTFIGNPAIMCQHLIGASYWEPAPDNPTTEAIGYHQIRAAHQVYMDASLKEVKLKGHAHASNVHRYKKIDGVWKLAAVKPRILWSEYDFEHVWEDADAKKKEVETA